MTEKDKLEKLKKLADAMYYAAQHLTTDASRLHKAMDEYHKFIINEYRKEEPTTSVWHDRNEEPKPDKNLICIGQFNNPLVLSSSSDSFRWNFISKWAYFDDLLNLSNIERTGKNWKEEPVSDFTRTLAECIHQAQCAVVDPMAHAEIWKEELLELANGKEFVSEDLEKEILRYNDSLKLDANDSYEWDDIATNVILAARHFAEWQKEQMLAKAVDVTIAIPYQNGYGGYTQLLDSKEALPFGENIKVLVIKED